LMYVYIFAWTYVLIVDLLYVFINDLINLIIIDFMYVFITGWVTTDASVPVQQYYSTNSWV
jgi:hypothetical protein